MEKSAGDGRGAHPLPSSRRRRFKKWKCFQRAKKVVSDSPGLVDFSVGLVDSILHLPDGQVDGQVKFLEGI